MHLIGKHFQAATSETAKEHTQGTAAQEGQGGFNHDSICPDGSFFPVRVLRPWHRFPRQAVPAPSLEVSKDGAWSYQV